MNGQDTERLKRLSDTFSMNFKITRLFAIYLEHYPELITSEMMERLCEGGEIDPESGIAALLAEAFGLGSDGDIFDRRLVREYLYPAVRILDTKRYTENSYYENIRIDEVRDGDWEFKRECYPAYRGFIAGDMIISEDMKEIPPLGFFTEDFYFPAVLEGGNEWMTLTPVDLDTSEEAIREAHGRVLTYGLGLGYFAYMAAQKEEVESVTVVEKSEEVIRLFKKHILPQIPTKDKIKIICEDAFSYAERIAPKKSFDLIFVDTWRDASDGLPMYERMKGLEHLCPDSKFLYWIENHLISRRRALNFKRVTELIDKGSEEAPRSFDEAIEMIKQIKI